MKTSEQLKEYRHEYYEQHKERYYQQFRDWCKANPEKIKTIRDRWQAKHPFYYRDYMRNRRAIVEPLIFEFLDNFFGDMDGFIIYLRNRDIPEQHVNWFKTDVKKHLEETKENENISCM